jgi:hypothetical protein
VKQIAKTAGDIVKGMATDARQQITGDMGIGANEQAQNQPHSAKATLGVQQQQQVQAQQQQLLAQTRQNLEKINNDIKIVRQKKAQQGQQEKQAEKQKKEQKKMVEEKKKEEPIWRKMLKSGSHEMIKSSGG